jgi:hypothetical protein
MLHKLNFHLDNYAGKSIVDLGDLHINNLNEKTISITCFERIYNGDFSGKFSQIGRNPINLAVIYEFEPGIYASNSFNFNHTIESFTGDKVYRGEFGKDGTPYHIDWGSSDIDLINSIYDKCISPYGVADNLEQIKEYFKDSINHPTNKVVISIVTILREDEKKHDGMGWRWHKWGEYIGTQNPQYEYLADEPEIESVMVFHAYMIK